MGGEETSRRRFLRGAGLVGAAVTIPAISGYVGYRWPRSVAESAPPAPAPGGTAASSDVERFVSRPDLRPPRVRITRSRTAAAPAGPRYLLFAPKGYREEGPGQQGCLITDRRGEPVWFLPSTGPDRVPMDFRVQTYRGEPVLTWWTGTVHEGYGHGFGVVYDRTYRKIAEVHTGNGRQADLHEFLITDRDTALLVAYPPAAADLTPVGGPRQGWVFDGVVQEVDIATGEVLFEWSALDHVGIDETRKELGGTGGRDQPFDYFHINSVAEDANGDLVVSARNTWAVYAIARDSGEVRWRLGGTRSDFVLRDEDVFAWQHDARPQPDGTLSLFDNSASPQHGERSRGMVLRLDPATRRATVERRFRHPADLLADNQGNMQLLPDGRALVGWGAQPFVSEFAPDGELLLDARLPAPDQTYRAYTADWTGRPADPPSVALGPNNAGGLTVYASWNGATEVRGWRVLAGPRPAALEPVVTVPRGGFETAVVVRAEGPHFAVAALDGDGRELGRSEPVARER
ncbi:secreted protein [Prauserella shujinwangii]|uniref:Secreted protein n=1 Tax=Prauserella shujinwangii TaxID=1453103 RepID=A0A2T0LRF1_9PSEU|nr:arylsulfotransferase family protein [Prauserella shujinwangii]PRX46033.1 secreted protein [Prauserella shujinwangii]